jgi:hypothetical protein
MPCLCSDQSTCALLCCLRKLLWKSPSGREITFFPLSLGKEFFLYGIQMVFCTNGYLYKWLFWYTSKKESLQWRIELTPDKFQFKGSWCEILYTHTHIHTKSCPLHLYKARICLVVHHQRPSILPVESKCSSLLLCSSPVVSIDTWMWAWLTWVRVKELFTLLESTVHK